MPFGSTHVGGGSGGGGSGGAADSGGNAGAGSASFASTDAAGTCPARVGGGSTGCDREHDTSARLAPRTAKATLTVFV
jgi:hypothetical protein